MSSKRYPGTALPIVIAFMSVVALWTSGIKATAGEGNKAVATADAFGPVVPRERRYKVEAVSFHADDESGPDWWFSDDIYAIWTDPKSGFVAITRTYEDVNTGDTVVFGPRCILPASSESFTSTRVWTCAEGGVPGPFDFEIALFEDDQGAPLPFCPRPSHGFGIGPRCIDDDLIDKKTVSLTTAQLEAAMPHVGDTHQGAIPIRNICGVPESEVGLEILACAATGPSYRFTYKLTRLPDAGDLPLHP